MTKDSIPTSLIKSDSKQNLKYAEKSIERLENHIDGRNWDKAFRGLQVSAMHIGTLVYATGVAELEHLSGETIGLKKRLQEQRKRLRKEYAEELRDRE